MDEKTINMVLSVANIFTYIMPIIALICLIFRNKNEVFKKIAFIAIGLFVMSLSYLLIMMAVSSQ